MEVKVYRQGENIPILTLWANSLKDLQLAIKFVEEEDKKAGVTAVYEAPFAKDLAKQEVSSFTDSYIKRKLREIDEDLADLISEKSWLEGVFAARGISPEDVRNATVAVIVGQKTIEQAISDLSIPEDLIPDFERAVEIARIIAWKEAIWKAEAKLEEQVDSMLLEELLKLDVKKLCEDTYSKIPLEV